LRVEPLLDVIGAIEHSTANLEARRSLADVTPVPDGFGRRPADLGHLASREDLPQRHFDPLEFRYGRLDVRRNHRRARRHRALVLPVDIASGTQPGIYTSAYVLAARRSYGQPADVPDELDAAEDDLQAVPA
jgi:hypothetical protein